MTLFEGMIIANLFVSVFLAYKSGKLEVDIETLYEGLSLTMTQVGMAEQEDDDKRVH